MESSTPKVPTSRRWLFLFMLLMFLSGSCNVLLKDFFVLTEAPARPGGSQENFNRPFLWSWLMKIAMSLCLLFHFERPNAPIRVFVLSSSLGLMADIVVNLAFFTLAGSSIQMLRGGKVIFTAILSVSCLGRHLQRYHIAGCVLVAFGMMLVGFSAHMHPSKQSLMNPLTDLQFTTQIRISLGLCCALTGELVQAILWVYQESVVKAFDIPPLQLVGLEGFIGVILAGVLIVALNFSGTEDISAAFYQVNHSTSLSLAVSCFLISVAFFNFSGIQITKDKDGSALARSIVDVSRSALIWVVELWLGWQFFSWLQLVGFCIIILGASIYNRLVVLPILDMSGEMLPISGGSEEVLAPFGRQSS